jgi:DNA polymerase-1
MIGDDLLETMPTPKQIPVPEAAALLRQVLEDPAILKIGHNFKFDWQVLHQIRHGGINTAPVDDTMLMHYCISGRGRGNGLDDITLDLLGHVNITFEQVCGSGRNRIPFSAVPLDQALAYAAEDADTTLGIWRHLKLRLPRTGMTTLYETIERPLVHVVSKMESTGILVDRDVLAALSHDYATRIATLEMAVHEAAGRSFNLGSPKQLGEVLFDELSLPGGKRTKTGAYSTDSSVLEPLAAQGHNIVRKLLAWRHLAKLKSTYADALQEQIAEDGRVRSSFGITATTTGRFSSTDPNLQNIPVRDEEGRNIRRAFIAPPGHRLMSVDYSQIELRLAATMADVPALKEAFQQGVDIHALTASQVFGVPMDDMPGEIRRRAKAINFGIIYGISGFGLANNLGIPQSEASAFIKAYFDRFPEILTYMHATKAYARDHGHVRTLFGRRCVIDGINDKAPARRAGAERQAINAPIQGTAADILKRAMTRMPGALAEAKLSARLLLTVHDELVFEVPEAELAQTRSVVRSTMQAAAVLPVPLIAEAGDGLSWAEAH